MDGQESLISTRQLNDPIDMHRVRITIPLVLLVCLAPLAGCLQHETVVRLNHDGSGTIEETLTLGSMLAGMIGMAGEQAARPGMFDERQLSRRAKSLGPGVRFVEARELGNGTAIGYRAVFAFDDINTVRLSQDISPALPEALQTASRPGGTGDGDVTFSYELGRLTVNVPQGNLSEGGPDDPEEIRMVAGFLSDLRFNLTLQLPAPILQTTARHHADDAVTLAFLDFGRLMHDDRALVALMSAEGHSSPDEIAAMEATGGYRMEPPGQVMIEF
jgi:hypothetical protein